MKKNNKGFSLIELIVVMAIVVTLAGLLVPQFMKYVQDKRRQACTTNKETILNVYEKCVYGNNLGLTTADFNSLMNAIYGSEDDYKACSVPDMYKEEIRSHSRCPQGGTYTVSVSLLADGTPVAHVACSDALHTEDDTVDFVGWGELIRDEGDDPGFDIPTVTVTPPITEAVTPTPTTPVPPTESVQYGIWPYSNDERWEKSPIWKGNTQYVRITGVPTGLFGARSDNGTIAYYALIKVDGYENGVGYFDLERKNCMSPQTIAYKNDNQFIVKYSGNTFDDTSVEQARDTTYPEVDQNGVVQKKYYFISFGDVYRTPNGKRYIYFHTEGSSINEDMLPKDSWNATPGTSYNNWYLIGNTDSIN